jgi:hypothetical protein
LLKMRRDGLWRRVEVMRRSKTIYETTVGLGKRTGWRRFGQARVWSGRRTLRLRASVKGVGLSNLVVLRLGD